MSRGASYLTGIGVVAGLAAAWVAVQVAWRRAFPGPEPDADALAGRLGCHGCACGKTCERTDNEEGER